VSFEAATVPLIILTLIGAAATVLLTRAGSRHWRRYQSGKGKPMILATEQMLGTAKTRWPLGQGWPDPSKTPLGPEALKAYARLAEERDRSIQLLAEAIIVVGGAALGFQIPAIVRTFAAFMDKWQIDVRYSAADAELRASLPIFDDYLQIVLVSAPLVAIVLGFALRRRSADYRSARAIYLFEFDRAAAVPEAQVRPARLWPFRRREPGPTRP
jgi:hypothetical protein